MNEQMNTPMVPPSSGVAEWFSVWRDVVTKPSEQTFSRIARSPNAKLSTALLWIFLGALVSLFLSSLVQGQMMRQMTQNLGIEGLPETGGSSLGSSLITAICGAPIAALISVVLTTLMIGVVQLIAKMFGGSGTFDQLAYAMAAILAPFSVIGGVLTLLAAIPLVGLCFGVVSFLAGLYVLVLDIMAVKGVNQFGWGQAIASFLLPVFAIVCCLSVGVAAILQALGPAISDTFESILTPVP